MQTHPSNPHYNMLMNAPAEHEQKPVKIIPPRRPFPLKLIFWVFVLWTLLGWLRFAQTLGEMDLVLALLGPGFFGYLMFAGFTWGLLGLPVLWGLLRRANWTPKLLKVAAVVYPALYWLERLILWRDPSAHRNWPFMLLLTVAWFGLVVWGLRSTTNRDFFANHKIQG